MHHSSKIDRLSNISAYDYYRFYLKNSRAFGVIWFFLTICFTLILIMCFMSSNWIGDTESSSNKGYIGVYRTCVRRYVQFDNFVCHGDWRNFSTLPNSVAFRMACFFVGFSCLLSIICLAFSLLALTCIKSERIFHICGWIQASISKQNNFYLLFLFMVYKLFFHFLIFSHLSFNGFGHLSSWMEYR
jgi:hypothetical protein